MNCFRCKVQLRDACVAYLSVVVYACDYNSAIIRAVQESRRLLDYAGQIFAVEAVAVDTPTLSDVDQASGSLALGTGRDGLPSADRPASFTGCAL